MTFYEDPGQTMLRSEALSTVAFLSLSGGLQDAYTYMARDGVFANAQTGNIVLFSIHLLEGDLPRVFHYLIPVLFFAFGVLAAELIRAHSRHGTVLHWQQTVLLIEILLLFTVGLLPPCLTVLANALVSFSCAMQVQSFRKVDGYSFASTMCIGDLRSGVEALYNWRQTSASGLRRKAGRYFGVILLFALGAGLGGLTISLLGMKTIWLSCVLLTAALFLMSRP